jgi:hypothetical protein
MSMVESMHRQDFAYLRGGRRTKKGGFRNRAAAPHKLDQQSRWPHWYFYSRHVLHKKLGHAISYDRIVDHLP